jgi:ribonucleoside-diphosphate reductase alpha chain
MLTIRDKEQNSSVPELSLNARKILNRRYLQKDENGKIIETPQEMFRRVARRIASSDLLYDKKTNVNRLEEDFYHLMTNLEFLPNSPTLMNAGTSLNQLSACFVLPVDDSVEDIFDALKNMALIHKSGGGVGFSFSKIRPQGDVVRSTKGIASGPLSFMRIFEVATEVIKQGGRRRGANMAVMNVNHPDILDFIKAKETEGSLSNFNLSVAVDDQFMHAVKEDEPYNLVNPRNKEVVKTLSAREVFDSMVEMAWLCGDPGIIFLDQINRTHPASHLGTIKATNPCGEQPLLDYESCNLGSVNLAEMVKEGEFLWDKLDFVVKNAVHFLDNVIDANIFPLKEIATQSLRTRKIGLGVMGFADMLIMMGIPYNTTEALEWASKIMKFISETSREASVELGKRRGSFPAFDGSKWDKEGYPAMRNATTTTIAPTGTLSLIAGVSSGIEPLFAIAYTREVMEDTILLEVNRLFQEIARKRGFYTPELMMKIARMHSLDELNEVPPDIQNLFVTAYQMDPQWQVKMQAVFQGFVDNGVSKTVNLPAEASKQDVKGVFLLAHQLKSKGITVFRYGSKKQVLYLGSGPKTIKHKNLDNYILVNSEYTGGCPFPGSNDLTTESYNNSETN